MPKSCPCLKEAGGAKAREKKDKEDESEPFTNTPASPVSGGALTRCGPAHPCTNPLRKTGLWLDGCACVCVLVC